MCVVANGPYGVFCVHVMQIVLFVLKTGAVECVGVRARERER